MGMTYDRKQTGLRLRQERKQRNLTQMDVANAIGVTNDAVSDWETGKKNIKANLLFAYMEYLAANSTLDDDPLSIDHILGFRPERRDICGKPWNFTAAEAAALDLAEVKAEIGYEETLG